MIFLRKTIAIGLLIKKSAALTLSIVTFCLASSVQDSGGSKNDSRP